MLPGLIECHSHPLFAGSRHAEYSAARRALHSPEIAEPPAAVSGRRFSPLGEATDDQLLTGLQAAYERILASGVTTLEVKSGYGLTAEQELHQLESARSEPRAHAAQPRRLVPRRARRPVRHRRRRLHGGRDRRRCPQYRRQGIAAFHDITCEAGLFTPESGSGACSRRRERSASRARPMPTPGLDRAGWETAVERRCRVRRTSDLHA